MIDRFIAAFPFVLAASCFLGCAPTRTGIVSPLSGGNELLGSAPPDSAALPPSALPAPEIPACVYLETLLDEAGQACRELLFEDAAALGLHAVAALDEAEARAEIDGITFDRYHDRLLSLFVREIPNDIGIAVPEEIAVRAFKRNFLGFLDTAAIPFNDSLLRRKVLCARNVEYDFPMAWNERVYRALHRFTAGRRSTLTRMLSQATRYTAFMQEIFTEKGLPRDLTYLPIIESGFNPHAYSYAHAAGIWQFISSTGRVFGLRRNFWIDERLDPIKSTRAAAEYLSKLQVDFSDWHLALAAYNCGEGGLTRAISAQGTPDFWQLKLHRQTMNYVPGFLASLVAAKNPQCFGIAVDSLEPFNCDTLHIHECIDLNVIARACSTTYRAIKRLNPHIRRWCTPPDMTDVLLYLPPGTKGPFNEYYAKLADSEKIKWNRYRIRQGDNLSTIAEHYRLPVRVIKKANKLRSNRIYAGKYLLIPLPVNGAIPRPAAHKPTEPREARQFRNRGLKPTKYRVKFGDTISEISELFGVSIRDICRWNNIRRRHIVRAGDVLKLYITPVSTERVQEVTTTTASRTAYRIRKGDNLSVISQRLSVPVAELMAFNGISRSDALIHPGDVIYYPGDNRKKDQKNNISPSTVKPCPSCITYRVGTGDNLSLIAGLFRIPLADLLKANGLDRHSVIHPGDSLLIPAPPAGTDRGHTEPQRIVYYEVQSGDNLWRISRLFDIPLPRLYRLNNLTGKSLLIPGDTLKIIVSENL